MSIVVNAVSTRVLLQFFFPESALCPIFFTLTFLDMIWVHVIHVLGMLGVLGGYITCFKTLGTCYLTCHVALTWEVRGAKHDKVKKTKGKFRLRIQNCGNIKTVQQFQGEGDAAFNFQSTMNFLSSKSESGAFKLNVQRYQAHFTLGVKANVQLKSSIPIGARVEISPKGFTLGVKTEIEKNIFNLPQVTIKC